ncbi:glycosyltransferase family 9 protein [Massilia sp. TS11]|uniref:glycosyltransferase family 9 protein n=1 Tax=Massilia sp. TS11 TaxID=2908003 RepID=UPI001EDB2F12|nr:glycosyltransferase family 9 protein [Massilia sp. TS11]MCG2583635.1 hypothetical protein [Massilia sp. TS11]
MKILFLSQDGKLGDAIVNTAFAAALADAELHVTARGATLDFWRHDPRITRVWPVERPGWGDTVRLGLALRRERFDAIVTWLPLRKEKNKLLLWLARPRKVIDLRAFLSGPPHHKIEDCAEALRQLGRPVPPLHYTLRYPLAPAVARPPYVLVNLCAADAERTLSAPEAEQLLRAVKGAATGHEILISCTDASAASMQALVQRTGIGQLVNTDGQLGALFRLCHDARLVISPDTALIHIASAYDVPVIGIYQNNGVKATQWGPRSSAAATILSDNPDTIHGFSIAAVSSHIAAILDRLAFPAR